MQISFAKVKSTLADINYSKGGVEIVGTINRVDRDSVELNSTFISDIDLICNRCGKEYTKNFNFPLKLILSDGYYRDSENLDVVEFHNNKIDFDFLAQSEVTSIKEDYNLCEECEDNQEILEQEF